MKKGDLWIHRSPDFLFVCFGVSLDGIHHFQIAQSGDGGFTPCHVVRGAEGGSLTMDEDSVGNGDLKALEAVSGDFCQIGVCEVG